MSQCGRGYLGLPDVLQLTRLGCRHGRRADREGMRPSEMARTLPRGHALASLTSWTVGVPTTA